ncbi:LysR family transcriptional regulator [Caballeronia arationis]|jgi:DNA-binding transcriptional LysR family regulator|uniref:DNA-binding transcriptional regulator, LysR family n=1 Tax=Caballeronia arationis TaxID=1777142 RepID=A0A7Z7IBM0_9BURK|nr:LysR family transcriptional regulator [Caballeronia arationis]SOE82743.1 DNA-binding transcriptional regulator, LysR family [Caballeronia arationis]
MNHLQAIRVFLKVAESGSFGRAAASFELSNAVITRYVALLETHLDTRLLNRTTRSVSLTEAGRTYAISCKAVIDQLDEIEAAISSSSTDPSGTLRLVASASFSLLGLTPLLGAYRERYPNVKLRLTLLHRPVDLVDEGFDVGIVVPRLVNSGTLINRPLFKVTPVVVAAPAYLQRHGTPTRPSCLAMHTFLAPSPDVHGSIWAFTTPSGDDEEVALDPAYTVNNSQMLRQAAIAGMESPCCPRAMSRATSKAACSCAFCPGSR